MNISALPPVVSEALSSSRREGITYLRTSDATLLKQYFVRQVEECLEQQKSTLVIIPDSMASAVPARLLTSAKLAHLTVSLDTDSLDDPSFGERLKKLVSLREIPLASNEFKKCEEETNKLKSKAQELLASFTEKDESGVSLQELKLSGLSNPGGKVPLRMKEVISELPTTPEFLLQLQLLNDQYREYFSFIKASSYLAPACFESSKQTAYAQEEISILHTALGEVHDQFDQVLDQLHQKLSFTINNEVQLWEQTLHRLEMALFDHETSQQSLPFETVYAELMPSHEATAHLQLDIPRSPELNWGEATIVINGIKALIAGAQEQQAISFGSLLKRLTPFNIESSEIRDLVEKAQSILRSINKCEYLSIKCPTTFLQLGELLTQLDLAKAKVTQSNKALGDRAYCDYQQMIQKLGIDGGLLAYLEDKEGKSWAHIIEYEIRQQKLSSRYHVDIATIYDVLHSFTKSSAKFVEVSQKQAHNLWSRKRAEAVTAIRNDHWEIGTLLTDERPNDLSLRQFINTAPELLSVFYPIITVHESQLNLATELTESIDQTIFLDSSIWPDKALTKMSQYFTNISICSSYELDTSNSCGEVRHFYSSAIQLPKQSFAGLETGSERYHVVLPIAIAMATLAEDIAIYRRGGRVLISFTDHVLNQFLEAELGLDTKHVVYRSSNDINSLVDILMTEDDISIFTLSGLLSPEKDEHLLWQLELLSHLKSIGIRHFDIGFDRLFENREKAIRKVVTTMPIFATQSESSVDDPVPMTV